MISLVIAAVLLLIHMLVCLVLWTLIKLGMLQVRGHMLPAMVLVPLWGPLLLVLCARGKAFGDALGRHAGIASLERRNSPRYAGAGT